jgi:tRNA-2-methylthio-N6-dimethylallyladenosine synthase
MRARVGSETELLVEGPAPRGSGELIGRTPQDEMAILPGGPELIGTFVRVRLSGLRGNTFTARRP